jgi:nucleoid-associated protein YgaU
LPIRGPGGAVIALLGLIALAAAVAWFGVVKPQGPGPSAALAPALPGGPGAPPQPGPEQEGSRSPQVLAQAAAPEAEAARKAGTPSPPPPEEGRAPAPSPAPAETDKAGSPSFDVVRIEPNGESVIAGRGAPGATIEMLRNGRSHARSLADTSGLFAFVPPPLAPGSHEISLSSIAPDGTRAQSRDSVTVVISEDRIRKPLVTLTSPDRPTVVLSAPDAPEAKKPLPGETAPRAGEVAAMADPPAASAQPAPPQPAPALGQQPAPARPGVKIVSVEAEEGGRLFVSGDAAAGATVRLYLNDSFIAPGGTGHDGKLSFAIGGGVRPGEYRVRLDDVDPVSGHVKSRAEVAFNVPPPLTVPLPPSAGPFEPSLAAGTVAGQREPAPAGQTPLLSAVPPGSGLATAPADRLVRGPVASPADGPPSALSPARAVEPGTVIVPQITTATVSRGDNLWRISRRIYGEGTRYTVIYDANQAQIRNPDRIYPGQIFVLPAGDAPGDTPATGR